jgi:hypothetical protein
VSASTVQSLKRGEARQRMADLRRACKSRKAAIGFERRYAVADGSKGRITNLAQVMHAMARWARQSP